MLPPRQNRIIRFLSPPPLITWSVAWEALTRVDCEAWSTRVEKRHVAFLKRPLSSKFKRIPLGAKFQRPDRLEMKMFEFTQEKSWHNSE